MARKKRNEEKINPETKAGEETANSGSYQYAGNANEIVGESKTPDQIHEEVEKIMQPFSEQSSDSGAEPETVIPENGDSDFIPKRERKKRQSKEEKKAEAEADNRLRVPGVLVNRVINRTFASIVLWIDSKVSKETVPPEYLYMSEEELADEKNVIAAEEFIKELNLSASPILRYLALMAASSVSTYIMIKSMMQAEYKKRQREQKEPNSEHTR